MGFMKSIMKRGQRGLTLVELMVVMSILAVLAAIVFPAVSGTQEVSKGSQVKQDASTVNTAMGDSFKDVTGAEVITPTSVQVLANNVTGGQKKSSRWAEEFITTTYSGEFPGTAVAGAVNAVSIKDGTTTIAPEVFVATRQAINLSTLATGKYIPSVPKSSTDLSGGYHNFLWVVKRASSTAGTDDSRAVEVYRLVKVDSAETTGNKTLTYERVY
ncbi:MAG: type II secretion system protein [Chloroflexi bacterium]|nr:type II secretion system protein [Chloroflexota bacterium]